MSFIKKLFGGNDNAAPDGGMYFYVRCNSCGEPIRIRMNPSTDLEPTWEGEGDEPDGFEFRKEILGSRCFKLIYGAWRFDKSRRLAGSEIEGGTEITAAEYEVEASSRP